MFRGIWLNAELLNRPITRLHKCNKKSFSNIISQSELFWHTKINSGSFNQPIRMLVLRVGQSVKCQRTTSASSREGKHENKKDMDSSNFTAVSPGQRELECKYYVFLGWKYTLVVMTKP